MSASTLYRSLIVPRLCMFSPRMAPKASAQCVSMDADSADPFMVPSYHMLSWAYGRDVGSGDPSKNRAVFLIAQEEFGELNCRDLQKTSRTDDLMLRASAVSEFVNALSRSQRRCREKAAYAHGSTLKKHAGIVGIGVNVQAATMYC